MESKNMKIYGFIFARGGSKGVPKKNIKLLGGKPLLAHSIETGFKSGMLDRIIVSTDDESIAEVAREYGAEVPFMRPKELSLDNSSEWLAWRHAINQVDSFDLFVSLPATAPLRSPSDIKECVRSFQEGGCDAIVTCKKASRHPSFNMIRQDNQGMVHLLMPLDTSIIRRQDAPEIYDMTTVAYVLAPEFIMTRSKIFQGRVRAVTIPEERAVDIDTYLDFEFAEFLYARQNCKN